MDFDGGLFMYRKHQNTKGELWIDVKLRKNRKESRNSIMEIMILWRDIEEN